MPDWRQSQSHAPGKRRQFFDYVLESDATVDDLPVEGLSEVRIPGIRDDTELRVTGPLPRLYTGDGIAGVTDGKLNFLILLHGDGDAGIELIPLRTGMHELIGRDELKAILLGMDEVVVYETVFETEKFEEWGQNVTVDEATIPEVGPPRKQR